MVLKRRPKTEEEAPVKIEEFGGPVDPEEACEEEHIRMEEEKQQRLVSRLAEEVMELPDMNIAVSGLAGRFPKSDSVNEFEENLYEGTDMVNDEDNSRFSCRLWGLPPRAGRLKDLSRFDAEFFGFSQEEANYIDYQMRILYEVVYESILDAGLNPASLRGSKTGVFYGLHCNEFENVMADDPQFKSNGYYAQFATKVADYFDFRGITMTFDAACASGFVGLHNAIRALDEGIVEQAVVCSSNIPIHPTGSFIFLQMQMLSPSGYSRFLDSRADGYVKSESVVSVLLQRKELALRNYASIMASMTSVDGFKKEGITFPSDRSQEELMRKTKRMAGISTNHVQYLEAHGTGTPAGDPQEARAIARVYCPEEKSQEERRVGPLLVGSVKTNMGHSEAASGLCALVKIAMMLENELIYKSLNFERPNKSVEALASGKLKFTEERARLSSKVVPMSCYGFGGSNVHAILRANNRCSLEDGSRAQGASRFRLVVMFGRGRQQLDDFLDRLLDQSSRGTRNCLSEDFFLLLDRLSSGRIDRFMNHRGFSVIDMEAKRELLRSVHKCQLLELAERNSQDSRQGHPQNCRERKVNLILPGLGCQWARMAAGLSQMSQFWSSVQRLAELLRSEAQVDLFELLSHREPSSMMEKFVAIVAYQLALIDLVKVLKVNKLAGIVGHSLGEISCAYAAGLLDQAQALKVAYRLGNTLDRLRDSIGGKMIAVGLSELEALELVSSFDSNQTIQISCLNGPNSVTLSGSRPEMETFCKWIDRERSNVFHVEIESSFALHNDSIMDESVRQSLRNSLLYILDGSRDTSPTNWISSFQTKREEASKEISADYFAECLCTRVDFEGAIEKLEEDSICLELGPHGLFEGQLRQARGGKLHYVSLMRRNVEPEAQELFLLESIGKLYLSGATFDLSNFYHSEQQNGLFPVHRQTPSVSSIFSWDHTQDFFVPRYPLQFSKSSAKCEMPFDILSERDKYMVGHCIEGRILFPATGYLFLIWRVFSFTKRKIYDACFHSIENELVPIEFHNVRLMRAVILCNRTVQVYIHFEEGTGKFQIKEGESVVVEGYARSPEEEPEGLLYGEIGRRIAAEDLELELKEEDVYKQFRVSGYDYGQTFRNIKLASSDGRRTQIKFNGYFVSLTDSILQTIFLAVSHYAPSGGLFLPTKFEYVRFQPKMILDKLRKLGLKIDLSESSLNVSARRDVMSKIREREGEFEVAHEDWSKQLEGQDQTGQAPDVECIFETFCDPLTGIIITDGIEMRGIKATPAPRRQENNEVLLECYQFVCDLEEPVDDERLTKFEQISRPYIEACDTASEMLLTRVTGAQPPSQEAQDRLRAYKRNQLSCLFVSVVREELQIAHETQPYDIKKNKNKTLLSVLDQLESIDSLVSVRKVVEENREHLLRDLIQCSTFQSERFLRPILETVIENSCVRRTKLKCLEVNTDDGLLMGSLEELMRALEPTLTLDYSLAHPNIERLQEKKLLPAANCTTNIKTYKFRNMSSLFTENQFSDLNLIAYKDLSCYTLPKQVVKRNDLEQTMKLLNNNVNLGGYVLILLRRRLTKAEGILLALSNPEVVGASEVENVGEGNLERMNMILDQRCKHLLEEAKRNKMLLVASKADLSGCSMLLFRSTTNNSSEPPISKNLERKLLHINHKNRENIELWLEELKRQFAPPDESKEVEPEVVGQPYREGSQAEVWLCAVATRVSPVSGLIGMTRALLKELGGSRLRCFLDNFTFKERVEDVRVEEIEASERFQEALRRDQIWNCVDEWGRFGSYRHLSINSYLSAENFNCSKVDFLPLKPAVENDQSTRLVRGAYVNNATKGDLSSFSWFECPFKYVVGGSEENLVRVAYSALNFRDIMLASGRLPLDAIPIKMANSDCLLGLEFSGFDADNRRIMGMVPGRGIASHIICEPGSSFKLEIPDWMSLEEAATIPVVYATTILALVNRGALRAGESILIHAGSGGVGQAAIRLASHHRLKIYTTVGSEEKRKFLLEEFPSVLSSEDIFSSRDCNFEARVMTATRGRGVDLVLNSLADDKLEASIRCLADGGRFLEVGKYDMSVDNKLELLTLDTNKTFHGILLDKLFDSDQDQFSKPAFQRQLRTVLETLREGLTEGYVKPIKRTIFKKNQIEEAMRFMATGKHIGKVLIEIDASLEVRRASDGQARLALEPVRLSCMARFELSPLKSYIVTGGLGGFGMELVKWLCCQGARFIVITSRRGLATGYQRSTLQRLALSSGLSYKIVTYDTTTRAGVESLIEESLRLSPTNQLGGLFHLAMVLKDTLLERMNADLFQTVTRPKVDTLTHLYQSLEERAIDLDYFVAFSSVTSGKGHAGQSNYAYANACLERLCEMRRARGKHGLAIQWGAIGDVGVAFENLGGNDAIIGGTIPQRIPSCLRTLSLLLSSPFVTCLSLCPINRSQEISGEKMDLVSAIMHVLGIKDSSKVSEQANLGELGLDSLMAVEIRQYIEREYDMTLNIQEIRALTIGKIREISEYGPASKPRAKREQQPDRVFNKNDRTPKTEAEQQVDLSVDFHNQSQTEAKLPMGETILDRKLVASFVPQLKLPRADFEWLNYRHLRNVQGRRESSNGHEKSGSGARLEPIFFIPPIHGQFDALEGITSAMERPCIGLNWTRRLAAAKSISDAAQEYLLVLEQSDWQRNFRLPGSQNDKIRENAASECDRIVDLVGYSYGATIAFEMMVKLHKRSRKSSQASNLLPGRLILLDGSPRQIELGSQFMHRLTSSKPLSYGQKLDQLLLLYIMSHTKSRLNLNYLELHMELEGVEVHRKCSFASKRLFGLLNMEARSKLSDGSESGTSGTSGAETDTDPDVAETDLEKDAEDECQAIERAMEAFCRRYELIQNYNSSSRLPNDCTLIRAEKLYFQRSNKIPESDSFNQDLDLSSVVEGEVKLFILKGDHESFLNENYHEIAEIISEHCDPCFKI